MPEEQTTEGTGQASGTDTVDEQKNTGPEKTSDWYEKELKKTRDEAANYRTKLRDAEAKLGTAKTPEEFEAARSELAAANKKLEHELLVRDAGEKLPPELRAVLKGETKEELEAHAAVLSKFVPVTENVEDDQKSKPKPKVLKGGLNGSDKVDDFDPIAIATKVRLGKL